MKKFACQILLILIPLAANCSKEKEFQNQQIQNVVAFSKAYGYIRYFHPIDENVDWDSFLVYGIPKVVDCKNNHDLKDTLNQLFSSVSHSVSFHSQTTYKNNEKTYNSTDTLIFHQYRGINTSNLSYLLFKDYQVSISNDSFIDSSLFSIVPNYHENYCQQLIPGLFVDFPLVMKSNHHFRINENEYKQAKSVYNLQFTEEQVKNLVDIIAFWNIIQHFYPYHTEAGMNWGQNLESTVTRVLNEPQDIYPEKYIFMLGKELKDGHFRILNYFKKGSYLPINVRLLNSIPVVTESYDTTLFKTGDVLKSINNKPVSTLIDSVKLYFSGSDEFVNYWSGNPIHRGEQPDEVTIEIVRGNKNISLKAKRKYLNHEPKSEFLDKGIYYCNLSDADCNMDTIINNACKANAVILDWRNGSGLLNVHNLFRHLIDDTLDPPFKFMIPQVVYPDHKFDTYYEPEQAVLPLKPRLRTKIVILSSPSNMSYQESIIKMAQLNKLAVVIGETTAGASGSINYSTLPSGLKVGWTGMKVVNMDGSQHHIKGIKPDIPVTPTLAGLKEGKDEILDRALEYLKME